MKPGRSKGIALVLVLWVLTLLTVMAVGLTQTQRTETALLENQIGGARFRAAAEAAVAYTMLTFLSPAQEETLGSGIGKSDTTPPWIPNGVPRLWQFDGQPMSIAVFNEKSRINLNQATPQLLTALIQAVGVADDDAARLADAIADWRDDDDLSLLNGAEDPDYKDAGRPLGAKDAPFSTVEELQQVLGMEPLLYQRLAPELTVDTADRVPDTRFASPAVLAAMEGIPLEEAQTRVEERDSPLFEGSQGPSAVDRGGPLYRIQVLEQSGATSGRSMEALVELVPNQQPPYFVHWRRYGRVIAPPISDVDPGLLDGRR